MRFTGEKGRAARRWVALAIALVFGAVVVVTTTISVGQYCLTSDGGNTRGLPTFWGR